MCFLNIFSKYILKRHQLTILLRHSFLNDHINYTGTLKISTMKVSNFERCDTCLSKASFVKMGSLQSYHRILGTHPVQTILERTQQNQNIPLSTANSSPMKSWKTILSFWGPWPNFQGRSLLGTFRERYIQTLQVDFKFVSSACLQRVRNHQTVSFCPGTRCQ